MTTAISTSDPNMERAGNRRDWAIQTSLLRSTDFQAKLPLLCVIDQTAQDPIGWRTI
jgi:hypothetical protein